MKRHHKTRHSNFSNNYPLKSRLRRSKLTELKSQLNSQLTLMKMLNKDDDTTTEASFNVSRNIALAKHTYSDGEFIKKNIAEIIAVLDPNNSNLRLLISQTPVSRHTIERRISWISANVEGKLQKDLANATAFSLALDKSTDETDNPQLAVYVPYVSSDVVIKEELLDLIALKETTHGIDIKKVLDKMLMKAKIPLNKFVSVATDGVPAMMGKNAGLIALIKNDPAYPDFLPIHCIIHRENLISKYFKHEHIMKTALEIVNFICKHSNRQFRNFIEELKLEDKPSDVLFYCIVRWLSTSNILHRFVELLDPIIAFLKEIKKPYPQLENDDWTQDLMFFTDIMQHLNTLNLVLQGKNKLVSDLSQTAFGFQNKIIIFQNDLLSKRFSHFPNLSRRINAFPNIEIKNVILQDYNHKFQGLRDNFQERFNDLRKLKPCFSCVITSGCPIPKPLSSKAPAMELELVDLQEDHALKMAHKTLTTLEFWKQVLATKYAELKETTIRLISVFSTTYCGESFYSIMKFVKSKHCATLTNQHVKELLRTALTSYQPNFKELTSQIKIHNL